MARIPLLCLVAFALWPVVLVLGIGAFRVPQVLMGKAAANSFPSGTPHGGDLYWRLNRAHMNALESLPVFAALVLTAVVSQTVTPSFERLAMITVGARVAQSIVHVSGNSNMHVNVRFTFFVVQLACFVLMGLGLATALL
jgi:uncharacterized MAPEG superfamily protein